MSTKAGRTKAGIEAVTWTTMILLWRRDRRLALIFFAGVLVGGVGTIINMKAQGLLRDKDESDADNG